MLWYPDYMETFRPTIKRTKIWTYPIIHLCCIYAYFDVRIPEDDLKKSKFREKFMPPPQKKSFNTFQCYSFLCRSTVKNVPSFYSLNIIRYATKTFSRCRKFFILLALKVSEWRIFILVGVRKFAKHEMTKSE
jgi:hypothetical protein